ncbi:MAG: hypothetical protein IJS42_00385 [Synergistaceae bacterium]|nr:hypothetical protein [Synergistaceae bacterium]
MDNSHIKSNIFKKFCAYMSLSLLFMIAVSYLMASHGFDVLADIFGGSALGIWLVIIAIGGISAFIIRQIIWYMKIFSLVILLILYSFITGIMFSVFFLGDSLIGIIIVSVIFILSALYYSPRALIMKNALRASLCWTLSVYLAVMMVISLWVLIWGAWDTTKRRYTKKKS